MTRHPRSLYCALARPLEARSRRLTGTARDSSSPPGSGTDRRSVPPSADAKRAALPGGPAKGGLTVTGIACLATVGGSLALTASAHLISALLLAVVLSALATASVRPSRHGRPGAGRPPGDGPAPRTAVDRPGRPIDEPRAGPGPAASTGSGEPVPCGAAVPDDVQGRRRGLAHVDAECARRPSAACCVHSASTSCRVCSTSCAATCRCSTPATADPMPGAWPRPYAKNARVSLNSYLMMTEGADAPCRARARVASGLEMGAVGRGSRRLSPRSGYPSSFRPERCCRTGDGCTGCGLRPSCGWRSPCQRHC